MCMAFIVFHHLTLKRRDEDMAQFLHSFGISSFSIELQHGYNNV